MKIGLIDIDSKIPNLALKKIEKYYADMGATVIWNNLTLMEYDKVYISTIFTKSIHKVKQFEGLQNYFIGGTGYNLTTELPKEIYDIKPKINIDFATRGCIRKCSFCFVPQKEGKIRVERDLYDIWDGKSKEVIFLDNNILALPEHFNLICLQAQKERIKIDFNQGMDIRLITDDIAAQMAKTSFKDIRFALDHISQMTTFNERLQILRKHLPTYSFFVYVLVGFDSTWNEDMERLEYLKLNNCRPYIMRHEKVSGNSDYADMAAWANQKHLFFGLNWNEFLYKYKHRKQTDALQTKLF
jgi:radical SAM superfamily enzyme YgiQ (UPF0313 family)